AALVPAVMVANATVRGVTTLAASISSAVIRCVLRGELGFRGVIISGSLSGAALLVAGYNVPRAAVASLQAGADMVLFNAVPSQVAPVTNATVAAIVAAVEAGTLEKSALVSAVALVLAAKHVNLCPAA